MKIVGYKGTDKDGKCRDFLYEVGKTYECSEAELCKSGFHFCLRPLDAVHYYHPRKGSRYFKIEAEEESIHPMGSRSHSIEFDTKQCTKRITILKELSLYELFLEELEQIYTCFMMSGWVVDVEDKDNPVSIIKPDPVPYNIHGFYSKSILEEYVKILSDIGSSSISGNNSSSISKDFSILISGSDSLAVSESNGICITKSYGISVTEYAGVSISGNEGISISGDTGISIVTNGGYAESGRCGVAVSTGFEGSAISGTNGMSVTNDNGLAESGIEGISVSKGLSSTGIGGLAVSKCEFPKVKGDLYSTLIMLKTNTMGSIDYRREIFVDGEKYKPNVWYTINDEGEIVECTEKLNICSIDSRFQEFISFKDEEEE